jgi:hypothetical protein
MREEKGSQFMKRFLIAGITVAATVSSLLPAQADPLSQRDMVKVIQQAPKRYLASEPGKQEQLTLLFGPYEIPPGQDSNRILADINIPGGFVKAVAPDLVDAASGRIPTEQEAHIHHAHWFRVTTENDCANADPNTNDCELYYTDLGGARGSLPDFVPPELAEQVPANGGLSWVFGTGEEKTQGGFIQREALNDADGNGVPDVQYGMEIEDGERQVVIFMIHNKTSAPMQVFVVLDVDYVFGTAEQIEDATGIPMHPVKGQLWGRTGDAPSSDPHLDSRYTAEIDGTAIVAGGHAHPMVYNNRLTNLGPGGKCTDDYDNDGYPGVTILNARKIDHVPGSWPYSEDFQMGVAKYGWRVNVHKGDVLSQVASYDVSNDGVMADEFAMPGNAAALGYPTAAQLAGRDTVDGMPHQTFDGMNHYGMYVDPLQAPEAYSATKDANGCPTNFGEVAVPDLLGADTPAVQQRLRTDNWGIAPYFAPGAAEGMQNHVWAAIDPTCGVPAPSNGRAVCENGITPATDGSGIATDVIHTTGFQYVPGGYGLPGALGAPAIVSKSAGLTLVNEDAAANIRHSITTCQWPCAGAYVSNYPQPDGRLYSGKMGNTDPIDGGFSGDWQPVYEVDMNKFDVGEFVSYYCTIHPSMRGAFQVVA